VEVARSGFGRTLVEYDDVYHLPTRMQTSSGAVLTWRYDERGQLVGRTGLGGTYTGIEWQNGLVRRMYHASGGNVQLFYDEQRALKRVVHDSGAEEVFVNDRLGRSVRRRDARGGRIDVVADTENRIHQVRSAAGVVKEMEYDAEGNVIHVRDALQEIELRYGHYHQLVERREQGESITFNYD